MDKLKLLKYYERFKKETIYLYNTEAQCFIKSDPGAGFYGKFAGGQPRRIPPDCRTVVMAIDERNEITKEDFENG